MITADTITDEQINELYREATKLIALCNDATRGGRAWLESKQRAEARARCAEILNARSGR